MRRPAHRFADRGTAGTFVAAQHRDNLSLLGLRARTPFRPLE
jgi:hypothetical protein